MSCEPGQLITGRSLQRRVWPRAGADAGQVGLWGHRCLLSLPGWARPASASLGARASGGRHPRSRSGHRGQAPQCSPGVRGLRREGATSPPSPRTAPPPRWCRVSTEPAEWPGPRLEQPMGRSEGREPASRTPLPCGSRGRGRQTRGPRAPCQCVWPWQRNLDGLSPTPPPPLYWAVRRLQALRPSPGCHSACPGQHPPPRSGRSSWAFAAGTWLPQEVCGPGGSAPPRLGLTGMSQARRAGRVRGQRPEGLSRLLGLSALPGDAGSGPRHLRPIPRMPGFLHAA